MIEHAEQLAEIEKLRQSRPALVQLEQLIHLRDATTTDLLASFVEVAWRIIEPSTKLLWNWHHELICEYLTAVYEGQIRRLIINMPPRYMKSILATITFPVWCWTKKPSMRFIFASYSQSLSTRHSVDRRRLIESAWYQTAYGDKVCLASDQNLKMEFENTKRGHMIATSMGGTVTGKGCDVLVVDDAHNPKLAQSEKQRQSAIDAFDKTFSSRLDDKREGRMIIVMQRLHEKDLSGHLLAKDADWEHLMIQGINETKRAIVFPISKRRKTLPVGHILHPERESATELQRQKETMGSYEFSGQYQQRPTPGEGGIIKNHWWRYWRPETLPDTWHQTILTMDANFKETKKGSFVVIQVWGRHKADKYLLDQVRGRWDFPRSVKELKNLILKWPRAHSRYIEEKANGPAIIASLRTEIPGIIPLKADVSKEARASAASPQVESGNCYLPDPSLYPWVKDFLLEFEFFPVGENDDQVDAAVYGILKLSNISITASKGVVLPQMGKTSNWR